MSDFLNERLAEAARNADQRARVAEKSALSVSKRFKRYRDHTRHSARFNQNECCLSLLRSLVLPVAFVPHVWPPPDRQPKPAPFVPDRFRNLELE